MNVTTSINLSNSELTRLFFAIVSLLLAAHFIGYAFTRFKLPRVIGEIVGGLLLGPSVLGYLWPAAHQWIFTAYDSEGKLLAAFYWFGLVLLMFVSGFEIEAAMDRRDKKLIYAILLGSTVIPFAAGWLAPAVYDFSPYLGTKANPLALRLVIAVAAAVTSIPVISRIFLDLGIINTRFSKVVLATATIHDVILWVALAIATGLVSAEKQLSTLQIATTVCLTVAFFGIAVLVMPRVISLSTRLRYNLLLKASAAGYILFICFLFSAVASVLNVNVVFGAFLAGIVIGALPNDAFASEKKHVKEIALAFFVPLYFAIVGLKLDLVHHLELGFLGAFLLFTTVCAFVGTIAAAKAVGKDWLSCFNLAAAMNARGGPGIVLATVAFDLGIIDQTFFVTLVLIAILTSLAAGYWFRFVLSQGWELLSD